jgi:DNA-binding MarR family transcriptional regulator
VLKRTDSSEKAAMLHQLLKLTNRLMAPFSTHLAHRYKISLNEFRLLMTIGNLSRTASHELAELTGVNVHERLARGRDAAAARADRGGARSGEPPAQVADADEEGQRLYEIMRPQSEKVADYLFSDLEADEVEQLVRSSTHLIDTLEAKDAEGRSLFLERQDPAE